MELLNDAPEFVSGHDDWKSMRLPSPNQMIQRADLAAQQVPVQEQDGAQRLRLGGSAHALFERQVIEKVINLCRRQFIRLARVIERDEPCHSMAIRLLGAKTIVSAPKSVLELAEERRFSVLRVGQRLPCGQVLHSMKRGVHVNRISGKKHQEPKQHAFTVRHGPVPALWVPPASLHAFDLRAPVRMIGEHDLKPTGFCHGDLDRSASHSLCREHMRIRATLGLRYLLLFNVNEL